MITTELQHLECQLDFLDGLQRGDAFEVSVVFTQDVPRVGNAEIVAVLLRPLLHNRPELVKLVARHRGEEVVNELSVHSTPEPSLERVLHVRLARASKLHIHKGPILVHDFLALVRRRDEGPDEETADKHGAEGDTERKRAKQPSVVEPEKGDLLGVLARLSARDAVSAPEHVG